MRRLIVNTLCCAGIASLLSGCGLMASTPSLPPGANAPEPVQLAKTPDNAKIYLQVIRKLEDGGQYYAALAYIDKYQGQWPANTEIDYLRATALRKIGRFSEADALYRKLLSSADYKARSYNGLGLISAETGDYRNAVGYFRSAAAADPTNVDILNNLGYAALVQKDMNLAQITLFKAGQLGPQDRRVWSNIALYEIAAGHQYKAERIMDRFNMNWKERNAIRDDAQRLARGKVPGSPLADRSPGEQSRPPNPSGGSGPFLLLQPQVTGLFSSDQGSFGSSLAPSP